MGMPFSFTATISIWIVVGSLLMIWGWRVLNWVWLKPKKLEKFLRQQGFAGNSYTILFGDLKEEARMMGEARSKPMNFSNEIVPRVLPFTHQTIKNYGKNSFSWVGPIPKILILDPDQFKTALSLKNDSRKFNANPLVKMVFDGLVSHEGAKWAKHRKIINPVFHLDKLKKMVPAFLQSCEEMIEKWERMIPEKGSCELDVMPFILNMAADVISRAAFGSSFEEGQRIFQLQRESSNLIISNISRVYIPGWRFLPTKVNKRLKENDKEIKALLSGIITKRQRAINSGDDTSDLLGILMESNLNEIREHGNNKDIGMSIEDVIGECKLFYIAGQETTGTVLVWTMILLSSHPEWQEQARTEVMKVFGNDKPHFDGLSRLKIVTMILNEVLRLYPPAGQITRRFEEELKLGEVTLRGGMILCFPIILIHHDREIWGDDADEFKPERFSEGISKATKNQNSFFPFGWGSRICIGQNFGMMEMKIALSMILQRFSFTLSSSYAHAPTFVLSIQPQFGAHIILQKL